MARPNTRPEKGRGRKKDKNPTPTPPPDDETPTPPGDPDPEPDKPPPPTDDPAPDPTEKRRISIDPITRIEGHLRIEVEVEGGKVVDAWSSGTLFRGIEMILKGRRPEDAWLFTQRLCGVCTYVHGATSVRSVEDAIGLTIPANARIVRNLLMGAQFLHDHIVHFYHLHALDWVDIVSALKADPADTEALATSISAFAPTISFIDVQKRLQEFVNSGQLGPFAQGYWGHPAYKLTHAENLLLAAHYLEAIRQQAKTARMHAIFGGKNPHVQSLMVGGVTCRDDINSGRIAEFKALLQETKDFIDTVYIPDAVLVAKRYQDWGTVGVSENYLTFGEFPLSPQEPQDLFFPRGVIFNKNQHESLDPMQVQEHIKHSWYGSSRTSAPPLHPAQGETLPKYDEFNTAARYSWLKAPRYQSQPMEVGPLARMLMAYRNGQGSQEAVTAVNFFLKEAGLGVDALFSTLGRTAARALETQMIADAMEVWIEDLAVGGRIAESSSMPVQASGMGLNEAPRGALGHWIEIQNGQIGNYQMVIPSTWNFGPRCDGDYRGPVEQALIGTPVEDPEQPLEILRVIHSFDPCIACAVHVIDSRSSKTYTVKAS